MAKKKKELFIEKYEPEHIIPRVGHHGYASYDADSTKDLYKETMDEETKDKIIMAEERMYKEKMAEEAIHEPVSHKKETLLVLIDRLRFNQQVLQDKTSSPARIAKAEEAIKNLTASLLRDKDFIEKRLNLQFAQLVSVKSL